MAYGCCETGYGDIGFPSLGGISYLGDSYGSDFGGKNLPGISYIHPKGAKSVLRRKFLRAVSELLARSSNKERMKITSDVIRAANIEISRTRSKRRIARIKAVIAQMKGVQKRIARKDKKGRVFVAPDSSTSLDSKAISTALDSLGLDDATADAIAEGDEAALDAALDAAGDVLEDTEFGAAPAEDVAFLVAAKDMDPKSILLGVGLLVGLVLVIAHSNQSE